MKLTSRPLKSISFFSVLLAGLLLCSPIQAAPAPSSIPNMTMKLEDSTTLALLPPAGHHFNIQAPIRVTQEETQLKTEHTEAKITVKLPTSTSGTKPRVIHASLYLCDEAKTYCARKTQEFQIPAPR